MDIKTLSTIIGHISSKTTLNVYAHVTDEMKQKAAVTIDRGIGKAEPQETPPAPPEKTMTDFQPAARTRRRPGTGYIKQIHEHRWSGRGTMTWPDGTTRIRTVSGKTEEECEEKLAELIAEMKAERARLKEEGIVAKQMANFFVSVGKHVVKNGSAALIIQDQSTVWSICRQYWWLPQP